MLRAGRAGAERFSARLRDRIHTRRLFTMTTGSLPLLRSSRFPMMALVAYLLFTLFIDHR